MKKVGLFLAACMMLVPTVGMAQPNALRYMVQPGDVVPGATAQTITGSVTLKVSPSGQASKSGGGCLMYISVPDHKPCDSSCRTAGGACANFGPGEEGPMVCWHKPAQESCHRSLTGDLDLGTTPFDNGTTPYPTGVKRPIRWRVVTCQNLAELACRFGPPSKTVLRYGDIKQFE